MFLGGKVGETAELGETLDDKAVPADDDDIVPYLKELLISKFGAVPKK